jgi:XapX domain-containing protein
MIKALIGIVLGVMIGVGCRFFDIPLPGPPAILGAVLAVSMATGYTLTDKILSRRAAQSGRGAVSTSSSTQGTAP